MFTSSAERTVGVQPYQLGSRVGYVPPLLSMMEIKRMIEHTFALLKSLRCATCDKKLAMIRLKRTHVAPNTNMPNRATRVLPLIFLSIHNDIGIARMIRSRAMFVVALATYVAIKALGS